MSINQSQIYPHPFKNNYHSTTRDIIVPDCWRQKASSWWWSFCGCKTLGESFPSGSLSLQHSGSPGPRRPAAADTRVPTLSPPRPLLPRDSDDLRAATFRDPRRARSFLVMAEGRNWVRSLCSHRRTRCSGTRRPPSLSLMEVCSLRILGPDLSSLNNTHMVPAALLIGRRETHSPWLRRNGCWRRGHQW